MSDDLCQYNCSKRPEAVSPYPDISGTVVVCGYVATAGIVIIIIMFYYCTAYDPNENPFRKDPSSSSPTQMSSFHPNPVDVIFLDLRLGIKRRFRKTNSISHTNQAHRHPNSRLRQLCVKCIQAMTDLQILSGISILISGYIQLCCGLSSYH
ncbi:uncharacterized protein BDZ99DRAFT_221806 [Mytilinidion resinicola]|uniref:Uncharacterized protein n=1 Tax=Mytilinidion resinicola TaxID=574789 RepID=A0A6A6XY45_9PEZI|nr:uncharacterized protein BDZ99DRAFT_221806 [Mytilinidion resinicola]KAF2801476.1 hypothetical protein BDZ99DRAFT_221806 [Mytilinidion resinicola]